MEVSMKDDRVLKATDKIAADAMRKPFYKRFISIFGRRKVMNELEQDPLKAELIQRGITPDSDIIFIVECLLAEYGVDKLEVKFAADCYEEYVKQNMAVKDRL